MLPILENEGGLNSEYFINGQNNPISPGESGDSAP